MWGMHSLGGGVGVLLKKIACSDAGEIERACSCSQHDHALLPRLRGTFLSTVGRARALTVVLTRLSYGGWVMEWGGGLVGGKRSRSLIDDEKVRRHRVAGHLSDDRAHSPHQTHTRSSRRQACKGV